MSSMYYKEMMTRSVWLYVQNTQSNIQIAFSYVCLSVYYIRRDNGRCHSANIQKVNGPTMISNNNVFFFFDSQRKFTGSYLSNG